MITLFDRFVDEILHETKDESVALGVGDIVKLPYGFHGVIKEIRDDLVFCSFLNADGDRVETTYRAKHLKFFRKNPNPPKANVKTEKCSKTITSERHAPFKGSEPVLIKGETGRPLSDQFSSM